MFARDGKSRKQLSRAEAGISADEATEKLHYLPLDEFTQPEADLSPDVDPGIDIVAPETSGQPEHFGKPEHFEPAAQPGQPERGDLPAKVIGRHRAPARGRRKSA